MTASNGSVRELTTEDEFRAAWPVMSELRPHLNPDSFRDLLATMRPAGYRLFAVEVEGSIVALAGVAFQTNLYYGSFLWVYELVTTASARSAGHGKALLDHLEGLARERGCDTIALSSGLKRVDAHRFYEEKVGFSKASYTFTKHLKGRPFMPPPDPSPASADGG